MNVDGIFLAGGKADVVLSNDIVLKLVVVSRARANRRRDGGDGEKRCEGCPFHELLRASQQVGRCV
jgi:hypothetical protein